MDSNSILLVENLKKYFPVDKHNTVKAVDDVSFSINKGEIFGIVGESGSGKSTIAYTIMGMYELTSGKIFLKGKEVTGSSRKRSKSFKKNIQIVFQDPGSSLNPYHDIRQILSLPIKVHKIVPRNKVDEKIFEILDMVELPRDFVYKSPNAIGGGEKQLVSIARALCSEPEFIILDEPTSSLDVSIQAKIINMLMKIHKDKELTYMLITHDLSLMRNISTHVAIMYLGKICEIAPTKIFYTNPLHPYTKMLLSAIPVISEEEEKLKPDRVISRGEIPSPVNVPPGCSFHTRCQNRLDICDKIMPDFIKLEEDHFVRCHLYST